ncbi:hypothetical protein HGA11_23820 [Mycolicibacterium septicum DSM 44393]|uniref:Polyketide cyclase n=1 Tax=Mycolicibacterium septicum DSM 44393 TaxID=1341646 RepID=A0A7X6MSC4_9MYCO|nr:hypothetical protein [Mycolicibacterium septicum]NKZ14012.1 hypothetical protein [Mycolicibacterium septicum DSM 44393]
MILNWGATAQERNAALPCDVLTEVTALCADRAISIDAPVSTVFGWLCQLRVAPYSYDLLDNFGRRSPRSRNPELTQLRTGQRFMQIFTLCSFIDGEHVTLQSGKVAVTYAVRSETGGTRLHVRVRFDGPRIIGWAMAAGDVVMMRKQLLTLRDLAEREASGITS